MGLANCDILYDEANSDWYTTTTTAATTGTGCYTFNNGWLPYAVCYGRRITAYGYKWKWRDEDVENN